MTTSRQTKFQIHFSFSNKMLFLWRTHRHTLSWTGVWTKGNQLCKCQLHHFIVSWHYLTDSDFYHKCELIIERAKKRQHWRVCAWHLNDDNLTIKMYNLSFFHLLPSVLLLQLVFFLLWATNNKRMTLQNHNYFSWPQLEFDVCVCARGRIESDWSK